MAVTALNLDNITSTGQKFWRRLLSRENGSPPLFYV